MCEINSQDETREEESHEALITVIHGTWSESMTTYIYLTYMRRSTWMRAFIMQVSLAFEASNLLATTWSSRVLYVLCMWYGTLHSSLLQVCMFPTPHKIISISHSYGDPLGANYSRTANPSASSRICRPRTIFVIIGIYPFFPSSSSSSYWIVRA
ncbi:hypothetical protein F5Y00DRAFT_229341 [Daldinia vernicosa]|uniref:uncharacterized protein n=1 Tax=Daldinia vernicosa TaxID=114800 RepID=UPI0020079535|nr:uncharacterized protein F5Y00DRAFT_229341 [Daldinia vernicosa]KAI0851819.1 hypothetical protein F5Y00DRAFT_229341 [Daldinia vernicosa]